MEQQYFEALREFGGRFLKGFDGDMAKATEGLKKINELLAENPGVIKFVANPVNQKVMGEAVEILGSGKKDLFSLAPKLIKISKKLQFNQ